MQKLRIISRKSKLALWQAEFVKYELIKLYPDLVVEIIGITTRGDKILDRSLDKVGGKGLFIKELELALKRDEADIAIHCLKDMPVKLSPEFELLAILEREDARDAFFSNKYTSLAAMPSGSTIGTSSPRRVALLKRYYPDLVTKLVRGNIDSRLIKLDNGEYDGIILAVAGVKRLGLSHKVKEYLSVKDFIPAIGQGALAIEALNNQTRLQQMFLPFMHQDTFITTEAEREVGRYLNASCNVPLAVYGVIEQQNLILKAMIADFEKKLYYFASSAMTVADYHIAAKDCAEQLIKQGALEIIKRFN